MNRIEFTRVLTRSVTTLFIGAVLASCGGGADVAQTSAPNTLSGVAAVGYPIVGGTVSVVCAAGVVPTINNTSATGAWQVSAVGLTLPCAVRVSGGTINGVTSTAMYHSLANSIGTVNITPLTVLIVANFAQRSDLDVWFAGLNPAVVVQAQITPASVDAALANLRTALTELTPLGTINPITTAFTPTAGNTTDDMLVALKVAMTTTGVTHAALLSNASLPIFTPPTGFGQALTTAFAGTVSGGVKPPVTGLIATAGDGQVTISWNPVAGATSYKLYMNTLPGISLTDPANMHHPSVTSPFHHPDLTNGTTYYFVVTAVNKNGESIESNEVSTTPQAPFSSIADGANPNDCVLNNVTGLMWEVKTTDPVAGGLRDWNKIYTNYDSTLSAQKFDGVSSVAPTQAEIDAPTNSVGFKNSVNAQGLCGFNDWRLPTIGELQSIVKPGVAFPGPTIDTTWFPNTKNQGFWSASPNVGYTLGAWGVNFNDGNVNLYLRYGSRYVRLVRAGQ